MTFQPKLIRDYQTCFENLLTKLLHYLSYRPRSEQEITTKLTFYLTRNCLPSLHSQLRSALLLKLKELNLLDDYQFALWLVESRLRHRPKSKLEITQELRQKGLDSSLINQVLRQFHYDQAEKDLIIRLVRQKLSHYSSPQQMINYLRRRGFSYSLIRQAVPELFK